MDTRRWRIQSLGESAICIMDCSPGTKPPDDEWVVPKADYDKLADALEFYAAKKQYEVDGPLVGGAWGSPHYPIDDDRGAKAREALGIEE